VAHGLTVRAAAIVDFMAKSGIIIVTDSRIYAPEKIVFAAADGGQAWFGGDSASKTDKTEIKSSGAGTGILASGNAGVVQNPDGPISFHTGPGGNIGFYVGKK
jgi:hypothetical protein